MNQETHLWNAIYQNAKIGSQSIDFLLPKVKSQSLARELADQQRDYNYYSTQAKNALIDSHQRPKEKITSKMTVPMGIAMNTFLNTTSSHIAEMVINGSTMGIVEISKELRGKNKKSPAAQLGRELLEFEQNSIDQLKGYLK